MLTLAPRRVHRRAGGPGKVRDVVELAVLRVRQDPGGFDPAELFRDLDRAHRVEVVGAITGQPRGDYHARNRAAGRDGANRFARHVCELAEQAALPS